MRNGITLSYSPLASVCWHQNSIIRIMIHSMISVFGVHFDDSDKCEKEKLGERFYRTEFSFFIFLVPKGIFGINMILSSLHQGTDSQRTIDKKCIDVIKLFRHSGSIRIRWTESGSEWWERADIGRPSDGQVMDRTLHPENQRLEQTMACLGLFNP